MPAGWPETQRLQELRRDLRRMNLRNPGGPGACRTEPCEQLRQTGTTVLDEGAEGHDLILYIKEVGLDSLVGGDGESFDAVLPCRKGFDRPLPARRRMSVFEETIRSEIVDRDRDHEPGPSCLLQVVLYSLGHVVRQERFLDISACAEQLAGRGESLGDFGDDSGGPENRELRPERGEQVTAMPCRR
jgi:hypothetical protein